MDVIPGARMVWPPWVCGEHHNPALREHMTLIGNGFVVLTSIVLLCAKEG